MVRNQAGKSPAIHERTVWCVKLLGIVMRDSEQDRHGPGSQKAIISFGETAVNAKAIDII